MYRERKLRRSKDRGGLGGFQEAIFALMIVTSGVVLLTTSFTLLSIDRQEDDRGAEVKCHQIIVSLLHDPALARSDRLLDVHALSRMDWSEAGSKWGGRAMVLLTFPDGTPQLLFDQGEGDGLERVCRSEPVNIYYHRADVRAALLTVWVWI